MTNLVNALVSAFKIPHVAVGAAFVACLTAVAVLSGVGDQVPAVLTNATYALAGAFGISVPAGVAVAAVTAKAPPAPTAPTTPAAPSQ